MGLTPDWAGSSGYNYNNISTASIGGYDDAVMARFEDLDLPNWTVDAAGLITAVPLKAGLKWKRFQPVPTDNTVMSNNGTRADEFSPMVYDQTMTGEFFNGGNASARNTEKIINAGNQVILARANAQCNFVAFGLFRDDSCGAVEWRKLVSPIKLTGNPVDWTNKNGSFTEQLTFSGQSQGREWYVDVTWASILAETDG